MADRIGHSGAGDRCDPRGNNAGLFALTGTRVGRYRVALSAGAWVDVVPGGVALPSIAHGHGPACSPVHKMVDVDFKPGRYLLQVTGSDMTTLPLMIARLPG